MARRTAVHHLVLLLAVAAVAAVGWPLSWARKPGRRAAVPASKPRTDAAEQDAAAPWQLEKQGSVTIDGRELSYRIEARGERSDYSSWRVDLSWRSVSATGAPVVRKQRIFENMCWPGCACQVSARGDELVLKHTRRARQDRPYEVTSVWRWSEPRARFVRTAQRQVDPAVTSERRVLRLVESGRVDEATRLLEDGAVFDPTMSSGEADVRWFKAIFGAVHRHGVKAARAGRRHQAAELVRWLFFQYLTEPEVPQMEEDDPQETTVLICQEPVESGEPRCKADSAHLYLTGQLSRLADCASWLARDGDIRAEHLLRQLAKLLRARASVHLDLADLQWARKKERDALASYRTYCEVMKNRGTERAIERRVRAILREHGAD